ncbi:hypothetical protein HYH84_12715 [Clostridium botulinum]|uniref:hypothetical protein n=1 Tax=Clostridium botulinum TaxID=1491 RepID=UPI0013F83FC2|nr:hypothetical protein [Clostridium botulinum]MBY6761798.1 hypothetical protein [Clostridium botulinum]NFG27260.1 hypothetical protein [Clostridium botulinum]
MINNVCNIANFNCTFNVNGESKPLLDYFESIVFPAMTKANITRETKKNKEKTAEYFFIDVKLIEIKKDEYALVGKHVKRAFLRINQDITPDGKITPIGEITNSAPTSTFILLLRNHRVIYFKNDLLGSPDIRSFNTTVKEIVRKFIRGKRLNLINELKKSEFKHNGVEYSKIADFTEKVINEEYPWSEINIVPIESKDLINQKFKEINKINELKLSIYNLNSENHFGSYLSTVSNFASQIGTDKIEQKSTNVQNVDEVKKVINLSEGGKFNYLIKGTTKNNETIKLTPNDVAESIPIKYNDTSSDIHIIDVVFKTVENRNEIKNDNSEENSLNYKSKIGVLERLKNLFS